jgi:hypothetical protein
MDLKAKEHMISKDIVIVALLIGLILFVTAIVTSCADKPMDCHSYCKANGYPVSGEANANCHCYKHVEDVWKQ